MSGRVIVRNPAHVPTPADRARPWNTPARLRVALLAAVTAGILLASAGFAGFALRADAVDRARVEAAHLVTVQTGHTRLLTADAIATRAVLQRTPSGTTQTNHYGYAVQEAVLRFAVAAGNEPDRYTLASAAGGAQRYAREVDRAQQLARAADPAAHGALGAAQSMMKADVLPRLHAAGTASRVRLEQDLDAAATARLIVVVALTSALLTLVLVQVWLARRTRRVLNPALVLGTVVVLITGYAALAVLGSSARASDVARRSGAPLVTDVAAARIEIFEAIAAEGAALLPPAGPAGNPAVAERRWRADADQAARALGRVPPAVRENATQLLATYRAAHGRVAARAATGDRVGAVALAADPSDTGAAGSAENLDVTTAAILARQVRRLDGDLAAAGAGLRLAGWLCLAVGAGVAVAGWRGVGRRLDEYR